MKRFKLIFVFLIFAQFGFSNSKADITIDAVFLSAIEVFFLNDLNLMDPGSSAWVQITMSNTGQAVVNVVLTFNIFADNVLLAEGATVVFGLSPGVTVITNQNLGASPYAMDFYSIEDSEVSGLAQQIAQLGALPSKVYQFVIGIVLVENSNPEDETILTINPGNPTLVQLISPGIPDPQSQYDPDIPIIYFSNPTFSWDTNSTDINLIVVEWPDGDDQEAAFNSLPLINENLIGGVNTFTPQSEFFPFEAGKIYLWRIQLNVQTSGGPDFDSFKSEAYAFKVGSPGDLAGNSQLEIIKGLLYDLYGQTEVDSWFSDPDKLMGFVPSGVVTKDGQPSSLEELKTAIENWIAQNQQTSSTIQ